MKMVIVMRKDLGMRKGKMIAQGGHAVDLLLEHGFEPTITLWREVHNRAKICVSVNSLEELFTIRQKAVETGIPVQVVLDAGKTEFKEPTYTCLAIGPYYTETIDKITGGLPLL